MRIVKGECSVDGCNNPNCIDIYLDEESTEADKDYYTVTFIGPDRIPVEVRQKSELRSKLKDSWRI